jgi:hypothetical protein
MASLTTVYMVSTVLGSLGSMAAGYVANRISASQSEPESKAEPEKKEDIQLADVNESLEDRISNKFGSPQTAKLIADFIQRDESSYENSDPKELAKQLKKIWLATHPDKDQCPADLADLCSIVFQKSQNIKIVLQNRIRSNAIPPIQPEEFTPLGDQTQKALEILSRSA